MSWTIRIAALILTAHTALLVGSACVHSPVWDEIGHLPAGLSHWEFGNFDAYRVNPPLVRMVATLPLLLASPRVDWAVSQAGPPYRPEWQMGPQMISLNGPSAFRYFWLARWASIPFSLLGGWICFRWATDLYGPTSGLLALILWCSCPMVLGHGQLLTPDVGAAACGVAAGYLFWRWLCEPVWPRAFAAGLTLGLAELTKFTWIILFGLWPLLWLVWQIRPRVVGGKRDWRRQVPQSAMILTVTLAVINLGYGFERTGTRLRDFQFVSQTLRGPSHEPGQAGFAVGNRFGESWLGCLPVPLPANYLQGIDLQKLDFERGLWSYLRGEWRQGGWGYYYLYALGVKEPLGTWTLAILALVSASARPGYSATWRDELLVVAPLLAVLTFVSSQTGFSHHLRYVLPMYPFAFIWISKVGRSVTLGHRGTALLAGCALTWSVGSSLYYYPHSLSYFNELVGGPKRGHEHLLNSNIDWGQDVLFLKRWLQKHPEAQPIGLAYSLPDHVLDPADVGISYTSPLPGPESARFGGVISPAQVGPLPGWYAIFVGAMQSRDRRYAYFEHFEPVEMLGYTVRIYQISLADANRVRRKLGLPVLHESINTELQRSRLQRARHGESKRFEEAKVAETLDDKLPRP